MPTFPYLPSGTNLEAFSSGTQYIGTTDRPFGSIYTQNLIVSGNTINPIAVKNSLNTGLLLGGVVTLNGASGNVFSAGYVELVSSGNVHWKVRVTDAGVLETFV